MSSKSPHCSENYATLSFVQFYSDHPLLLLCKLSGHRLTDCRVRATDRAAASTSSESGAGAYGSFERPLACALEF